MPPKEQKNRFMEFALTSPSVVEEFKKGLSFADLFDLANEIEDGTVKLNSSQDMIVMNLGTVVAVTSTTVAGETDWYIRTGQYSVTIFTTSKKHDETFISREYRNLRDQAPGCFHSILFNYVAKEEVPNIRKTSAFS